MAEPKWELWFVLPNVNISRPVESPGGFLAYVPFEDDRLRSIAEADKWANEFLEGFTDMWGKKTLPSAIIARSDTPKHLRTERSVVAFRNCVALPFVSSCIIFGGAQFYPRFSDLFQLHPIRLGEKGNFSLCTPAQRMFGHFIHFRGQCSPHLPYPSFPVDPAQDTEYLGALLRQWLKCFVDAREGWRRRALFRSLEMAYQAAASPGHNESSLYDCGALVALWVSAFECLFHPGFKGEIGWKQVVSALGEVTYGYDVTAGSRYAWLRPFVDRRFALKHNKRTLSRERLLPVLYKQLYDARNAFLHGNPVTEPRLRAFRKRDRPLLLDLAPIIYRQAILRLFPLPRKEREILRTDVNIGHFNWGVMEAILRGAGRELFPRASANL